MFRFFPSCWLPKAFSTCCGLLFAGAAIRLSGNLILLDLNFFLLNSNQTCKYAPACTCLHLYDVCTHTWVYIIYKHTHTVLDVLSYSVQKHTLSNTNRPWNVGNRWRPVLFSFYSVHFPLGTSKENICVWNTPKVQGIIHIRAPRWKQIRNSFDFIFAHLFIKDKQIHCCIRKKKEKKKNQSSPKSRDNLCFRVCVYNTLLPLFLRSSHSGIQSWPLAEWNRKHKQTEHVWAWCVCVCVCLYAEQTLEPESRFLKIKSKM